MRLKHPIKRGIAIVAAAGIIASGAAPAFADAYGIATYGRYYVDQGSVTVDGTKVIYTDKEDGKEKTFDDKEEIIITGKSDKNNVTLKDTTVTIEGLEIDASGTGKAAISASGNVSIELDGKNTVSSGWGHAGVEKTDDGVLTIRDEDKDGSLKAEGGSGGAGIGGGDGSGVGANKDLKGGTNITVEGGTITAVGGNGGAGIGGGLYGEGDVTIKNGKIQANGNSGAGIGGGQGGNGTVRIKDGNVTATAKSDNGDGGAGIGSGKAAEKGTVTIDGGTVDATGGYGGAGVGGGSGSDAKVTITGGDVTARGTDGGIGSGFLSAGAGIGSGGYDNDKNTSAEIEITGGKVNATGACSDKQYDGYDCGSAGIGNGSFGADADIKISGGEITAAGGKSGAGIGGGFNASGKIDVDISQGEGKTTTVESTGGNNASGIGGGYGSAGNVTISGGNVVAKGDYTGIGGGNESEKSTVTISGGKVSASGKNGIGDDKTTVTISADKADTTVDAVSDQDGAQAVVSSKGINKNAFALGNAFAGIVRFFAPNNKLEGAVHNQKYIKNNYQQEEHFWQLKESVKPSCTAGGYEIYECGVEGCGEQKTVQLSAAHEWGEWTVTTPATEDSEGVESRTCRKCSGVETRAIPKLKSTSNGETSYLRVLDQGNADCHFETEQQGNTLIVTSEYEQATTLTGNGTAVRTRVEQGVKMLVFVTPQGTAKVDAAALAAMLGEDGVFRLVVTESSMDLWVNGVLHNELLK